MCPPEEALGGGRAVGTADVEVVHGGERGEPAVAQAMTPVMMQRQLAVASFHTGAAALEQIGASAGDLFDPSAVLGRETLQRMIGAPQDVEQRGTRRLHAVSGLGRGAAGGDALEVDAGDELLRGPPLPAPGIVRGPRPWRSRWRRRTRAWRATARSGARPWRGVRERARAARRPRPIPSGASRRR